MVASVGAPSVGMPPRLQVRLKAPARTLIGSPDSLYMIAHLHEAPRYDVSSQGMGVPDPLQHDHSDDQYNGSSTTPAAESALHISRPADDGMPASRSKHRTPKM